MKHKFGYFAIWALIVVLGFSFLVWSLWNWLIPSIFGLNSISYIQAIGLFILTKILFGNFGLPWRKHRHNGFHQKWEQMTDEERKEFINRRKRFGFHQHFFDHANSHEERSKD